MEIHRHQEKLEFLLPTLERMLKQYPNLYIDLSWTMLRPYLLDAEGQPDPAWVKLVSSYPARFMLGSDVVGRFSSLPDYLPEKVAHQVALDNFLAVLPRKVQAEMTE
ncbi:MAG: amidohydrolase, partial [Pseudomonadales bacterium]